MLESWLNVSDYRANPHAVPVMAAGGLIFLIGVFILAQTRKNLKTIAFFLFCMSLSLWLFPMGFVYMSERPEVALKWYRQVVFFGVVNIMPTFYLFSVATAGFFKRQRHVVVAGFIISNLFYLLAVLTGDIITGPNLYYWGYYPHYASPIWFFFVVYGALFISSEINLWMAWRREAIPVKRAQIMTIFVGLLIGFLASFDFVAKLTSIPLYPFGFIPSFILSSMVAYSVIRHRAFDIETVIHKTILWILSFSIITIPIFITYRLLFDQIRDSFVNHLTFGIFSFFVFTVYLREIQPKIDHIFQRRKANLDDISARFTADLVYLKDFDSLIRRVERALFAGLYPQRVDIFIFDESSHEYRRVNSGRTEFPEKRLAEDNAFLQWMKGQDRIIYREFVDIDPVYAGLRDLARNFFQDTGAMVVLPLVLNERLLGVIGLHKKANLKKYNAVDFQFLMSLKNQSAIAISNSLIYQSIEDQVRQRTRELVEVQKQLIQAEKLATMGTLSGGVAHEINNPLTAILTNVQMLLAFSHGDDVSVDRESLELIEEATQRCRTIVQKLMMYARKPLETAEEDQVTDLRAVLEKTVALICYQLEQDSVRIEVKADAGSYFVLAHQNELEQVLTNLVLNARDAILAAGQGGNIQIVLSRQSGRIRLQVKDEGIGISEDALSKIFDPFYTTKDVGKGLGLGLSISQSIVEKYHGTITVKSVPGQGSEFIIDFPESGQAKGSNELFQSQIRS